MKKTIGLLPSVFTTLDGQTKAKVCKVESLAIPGPKARLCIDEPAFAGRVDDMEFEMKRFLILKLLNPKLPHRLVVSEMVDAMWHHFILHTRQYRSFSKEVFGGYLNHVPILPDEKPALEGEYLLTLELYRAHFGEPDSVLWDVSNWICWCCTDVEEAVAMAG